jgi:hypothetical protein
MDEDLLSPLRSPADATAPNWDAMEARLVASCAPRPFASSSWRRSWLAAAAVALLATAITFYPTMESGQTTTGPASVPESSTPLPSPSSGARDRRLPVETAPSPASLSPQRSRARVATAPLRAASEPVNEFVLLPGAAALPALESGRVVRMAVPLASLPAYGIDFVHDATPQEVHADFLIGQDGLPRAVRLARHDRP